MRLYKGNCYIRVYKVSSTALEDSKVFILQTKAERLANAQPFSKYLIVSNIHYGIYACPALLWYVNVLLKESVNDMD